MIVSKKRREINVKREPVFFPTLMHTKNFQASDPRKIVISTIINPDLKLVS